MRQPTPRPPHLPLLKRCVFFDRRRLFVPDQALLLLGGRLLFPVPPQGSGRPLVREERLNGTNVREIKGAKMRVARSVIVSLI